MNMIIKFMTSTNIQQISMSGDKLI